MGKIVQEFTRTKNKSQTKYITDLFNKNDIEYRFGNYKSLDEIIPDHIKINENIIKIPLNDFRKANEILRKDAEKNITNAEVKNHYFNEYKDDDLLEVLKLQDEWSHKDVVISQRILNHRGFKYTKNDLNKFWEDRLRDLQKPKRLKLSEKIVIITLLIIGFVLPIIEIIVIIWSRSIYKKTKNDPVGCTFYLYGFKDRKLGENVFYISILPIIILMVYLLLQYSARFY